MGGPAGGSIFVRARRRAIGPRRAWWHRRLAVVPPAGVLLLGLPACLPPRAPRPCGESIRRIACENSLPGTARSQWGGSDDGSINGFTTDFSVNHGETVSFKVATNAAAYTIDIYRFGWYQGKGARKITTITPTATLPQSQPACRTDATTHLVACGNWAVSARWAYPAT